MPEALAFKRAITHKVVEQDTRRDEDEYRDPKAGFAFGALYQKQQEAKNEGQQQDVIALHGVILSVCCILRYIIVIPS